MGSNITVKETWNDRIKQFVETLVSAIPTVGFLPKAVVELCWPSTTEIDIWGSIRSTVAHLVDSRILDKELEERKEELDGLKKALHRYYDSKTHEKGAILASLLTNAETIYAKFSESINAIFLIPMAVAFAPIHLTLLREQLSFGKELYEEDNTAQWKKDLENQYTLYRSHFRTVHEEWYKWRLDQIKGKYYRKWYFTPLPLFFYFIAYLEVEDSLSKTNIKYEEGDVGQYPASDFFKPLCTDIKNRIISRADADMACILSSTFLLHRFIPERKNESADVDPKLQSFWLGPYSPATLGLTRSRSREDYAKEDDPGVLTEIYVREWNSIDGIQFIYTDHEGNFTGNPKGGTPHHIKVSHNNPVIGIKMRFANGIMCRLEIIFADKTSTGPIGNRGGWDGPDVSTVIDDSYQLISGKFISGSGLSGTTGTDTIWLLFKHRSLM